MAMILNILERLGPPAALRLGRSSTTSRSRRCAGPTSIATAGSAIPTSSTCRSIACSRSATPPSCASASWPAAPGKTPLEPAPAEGEQTTHYSVVDAEGNAAAVTTTINSLYGNGVVVAGAGFLLNNEMDDFAAKPGSPNQFGLVQGESNAIEPGKRMLSSMCPTIVVDRKRQAVDWWSARPAAPPSSPACCR